MRVPLFAAIVMFSAPANAAPTDAISADRTRIQTHLARVERELRSRSVGHLPPELRAARLRNLDLLHEYWMAGVFPHNTSIPERHPIFIDDAGRACAVGALILASDPALAHDVARREDYAYLRDMRTPGLATWVSKSGLTFEEAEWIQPGYCWSACPGSMPVCGVDGKTYQNACVAVTCMGVAIAYEGACVDGGYPEVGAPDVPLPEVEMFDTWIPTADTTVEDTFATDTRVDDTFVGTDTAPTDTQPTPPPTVGDDVAGRGCAFGAEANGSWLLVALLLLARRR